MSRREQVLVSTDWLASHLDDPGVVVLEVDERPLICRADHIRGAHCLDWHDDLQDPVSRDIPSPQAITEVWSRIGMRTDSTVVFYGDRDNWYAAFAFWLFRFYGGRDLRMLDGGRQAWVAQGASAGHRPARRRRALRCPSATAAVKPTRRVARRARRHRRWRPTRRRADPRRVPRRDLHRAGIRRAAAQRAGHIPGALNVPWDVTVDEHGMLRGDDDLRMVLEARGLSPDRPAITYCRIGERSAHTWFVMRELLGMVARNYDGSWAEWGSMIGMPVAVGPAE